MRRTVGIIGGGAAGMTAAIAAARCGARVTILERNDRVGKKLLMTGNGRCNLGNRRLSAAEYYSSQPEEIEKVLQHFGTEDTITFFQEIGLLIKDKNGYLYPACEQASVVLDVLRYELQTLGVELILGCKVNHIRKEKKEQITVGDGQRTFTFDAVILCCGGKAAPTTGSDGSGWKLAKQLGHALVPAVPALVQLKCEEASCKAVSGVRADARIRLFAHGQEIASERGELQLTDYGISGIPVFQLSRVANYLLRTGEKVSASIDFLPDFTPEDYERLMVSRRLLKEGRTAEEFFTGLLHKKLMQLFLKCAGLKGNTPMAEADEEAVACVYRLCRDWKLTITGSNPYENAQVSAGGVELSQITENMESRLVPGIYFAGEILDVDGKCGGYNLQWAWSTGSIAGEAAAGGQVVEQDRK